MSGRLLQWTPLAAALAWLLLDGPRLFLDDAQLVVEVLIVTFITRSVGLGNGLTALSWSIAIVAPLTVGIGWALAATGLEMTDGAGNGVLVPLVEETLKLGPVAGAAILARRWRPFLLNASDLLLLGVMSGAGFSMVESSYFDRVRTGVRYAAHIGPFNLLPTAWGEVGYVGHAAATGFVAVAIGLGLHLKRAYRVGWWWALPATAFIWVALEHSFANLYVNTGSDVLRMLGRGRLTPWLFAIAAIAAIAIDAAGARATYTRSPALQRRSVLVAAYLARERREKRLPGWRQLLAMIGHLRLMNLTACFARLS